MGIPHIVLLLLISYMMGRGGFGVAFAVAVTHWPELTRIVRAEVLQVKNAQYVKAAEKMGKSKLVILLNDKMHKNKSKYMYNCTG